MVAGGFTAEEAAAVLKAARIRWDDVVGYLIKGTHRNPPITDKQWDSWAQTMLAEDPGELPEDKSDQVQNEIANEIAKMRAKLITQDGPIKVIEK